MCRGHGLRVAHEVDGFGRWRRNDLALLATSRLVIEEENAERLVLEPAP